MSPASGRRPAGPEKVVRVHGLGLIAAEMEIVNGCLDALNPAAGEARYAWKQMP